MGMQLAKHVTHDAGTLTGRFVISITGFPHHVKHTAMNRLKTIAHIRQSTCNDDRHRIIDIAGAHLFVDVHLDDSIVLLIIIFFHLLFLDCNSAVSSFFILFGRKDTDFPRMFQTKKPKFEF